MEAPEIEQMVSNEVIKAIESVVTEFPTTHSQVVGVLRMITRMYEDEFIWMCENEQEPEDEI